MPRWPISFARPAQRALPYAAAAAILALGLVAESSSFAWDDARDWVPDLTVGATFAACGALAWDRRAAPALGALLLAAGGTWFLGNFDSSLLYLHRGPLIQLVLTAPGWRPRSRLDAAAVASAYVAALVTPIWQSEPATVVAAALAAVAARAWAAALGPTRRARLAGLRAAVALALVLVAGAVARLTWSSGDAVQPALLAYELVLCGLAVGLVASLGDAGAPALADLVVELGETRSGTLRDRLASTLGDPTLELGYWSAASRGYVDDAGRPVPVPVPAAGDVRSATTVEREGKPFAVLVHDPAVLDDPALVAAVAAATRLTASNANLQAEARAKADELRDSRRRLLLAADDERQRLEARLRDGPERRLAAIAGTLAAVVAADGAAAQVERARAQLRRTRVDLDELAQGLHPRELVEGGLRPALDSLTDGVPLAVEIVVDVPRLPAAVEATVYFVCAEALANVVKHARARHVRIEVARRAGAVTAAIGDDGVGGADRGAGSGLQGLVDRVEALGGAVTVTSPAGRGTRLVADVPLDAGA